mmetsp:Transcript_27300/g.65810  ORF Transcript_27300/g.65810 Transcript_27300/m.65810 type:complete len:232 (-) Transcript_27300:162-857(-)
MGHLHRRIIVAYSGDWSPVTGIKDQQLSCAASCNDVAAVDCPVKALQSTKIRGFATFLPLHIHHVLPHNGNRVGSHVAFAVTHCQAPVAALLPWQPPQSRHCRQADYCHLRTVLDLPLHHFGILGIIHVQAVEQLSAAHIVQPKAPVHIPSCDQLIVRRPPYIKSLQLSPCWLPNLPGLRGVQQLLHQLERWHAARRSRNARRSSGAQRRWAARPGWRAIATSSSSGLPSR